MQNKPLNLLQCKFKHAHNHSKHAYSERSYDHSKTCVEWKSESNWVRERIRTAAATTTTAECTNSRCTANQLAESARAQQQRACTLSLSYSQLLHHQHTLTFQHCADLSPSRTLHIGLRDCALSHSTRTVFSLAVLALLLLLSPNWLPASFICRLRSQLQTSENRWRVQTYAQHHSDSDWIRRVCKLKSSLPTSSYSLPPVYHSSSCGCECVCVEDRIANANEFVIKKEEWKTSTTTTREAENNAKLSPLLHTCKSIAIEWIEQRHPPPTHTNTVQPLSTAKRARESECDSERVKCHPSETRKFAAQFKCATTTQKKLHLICNCD